MNPLLRPLRELGRRIAYRLASTMFHQPELLRLAAALLRRWPALNCRVPVVASRSAVAAVLGRPMDFSNIAHAGNLIAGSFLIGMEISPAEKSDRHFLRSILPSPADISASSAAESKRSIERLSALGRGTFNLIDDYMVWIVWRALGGAYGAAADAISSGASGEPATAKASHDFFLELRYLGAHLMTGSIAPEAVQRRAEEKAVALNRRIDLALAAIEHAWPAGDSVAIRRNALGLLWVAHPAVVQAGALVIQELLARPEVHAALSKEAQALGEAAWTDPAFGHKLVAHILELLRFRPVFPILPRAAPRDTVFEPGGACRAHIKAGHNVTVTAIGAMFDPQAVKRPAEYHPESPSRGGLASRFAFPDDQFLLFGLGERACIAKHLVPEILASALAGLLQLPDLRWARRWSGRICYDGPIIVELPLAFGKR